MWDESQLQQWNPALLPRAQMPWSNVGQVAHVSPTPWVKSRYPFVSAAQQLITSSDGNNRSTALWAAHQQNAKWADNPTRLRTFIPDTDTPQNDPPHEQRGPGLTASAPVSDVSAPDCTNGVWLPLGPVSVAQKNKPSTMLSSNVQSIDLLVDCTSWRFWMMRQSNGCSTLAPRSSAA